MALHAKAQGRAATGHALRAARPARLAVVRPQAYLEEKTKAAHKGAAFKNQLEALKSMSVVVADSGEMALVKKFSPQDCTTNPR